jgi:hypothetical protein
MTERFVKTYFWVEENHSWQGVGDWVKGGGYRRERNGRINLPICFYNFDEIGLYRCGHHRVVVHVTKDCPDLIEK